MEIISYVISGALRHEDSLGNGSVIRPGDVQRMTAGNGVRHSEYNASDSEDVHFLQIWIQPEALGLPPGYEQKTFPPAQRTNRLQLVVAQGGRDEAARMMHTLKGTGGTLGLVTLAQQAAALEAALRPRSAAPAPSPAHRRIPWQKRRIASR